MANKFRNSISIRKELYNAVKEFCTTTKESSLSGYLTRLIVADLAKHNIVVDIPKSKNAPKIKTKSTALLTELLVKPSKVVSETSRKIPKQILEDLPTEKPVTIDVHPVEVKNTTENTKKPDLVIPIIEEDTSVPKIVEESPVSPTHWFLRSHLPFVKEPKETSEEPKETLVEHPMGRYDNLLGGTFRKPKSLPPAKVFDHPPIDTTKPESYLKNGSAKVTKTDVTQKRDANYDLIHPKDGILEGGLIWVGSGKDTRHPEISPKPSNVEVRISDVPISVGQPNINLDAFAPGVLEKAASEFVGNTVLQHIEPSKKRMAEPTKLDNPKPAFRVDSNQTFVQDADPDLTRIVNRNRSTPNSQLPAPSWQDDMRSNNVREFGTQKDLTVEDFFPQSEKEDVPEKPTTKVETRKKPQRVVSPNRDHKDWSPPPPKHLAPPVEKDMPFRNSGGGMSFSSSFDDFDDDERYRRYSSFSDLPPDKGDCTVGDITKDANGNSFFDGPTLPPPPKNPHTNIMDSVPGPSHVPTPPREEVPISLWQCKVGDQVTYIVAQNVEQAQKYVANATKTYVREDIQPIPYLGHYNPEFLVPGVVVPDEERAVFKEKEQTLR